MFNNTVNTRCYFRSSVFYQNVPETTGLLDTKNMFCTIQKTVEVKTLQVLPLPHETIEWSCPTLSQYLNPL